MGVVVAHELGHIMGLWDGYLELNADGSVQKARGSVELMNHNDLYIVTGLSSVISNLHITMIIKHLNAGTRPSKEWDAPEYNAFRPSEEDNLAKVGSGDNKGKTNADIMKDTAGRVKKFNTEKGADLEQAQIDLANAVTETDKERIQKDIEKIQKDFYRYTSSDDLINSNLWYRSLK